jgi:spore germination cell wall hydrolase CwlJ-like protein
MDRFIRLGMAFVGAFLCVTLVSNVTEAKIKKLQVANIESSKDVITIKTRERQLECLAINIYREAGSEPFEGKVAVAQVTMNRAESGRFPNDICGVVYQKNVVMERVVCQFSWACDHAIKARPVNNDAYKESYEVAKKVLLENFRLSVLKDAMFYHADYVNPRWKFEKIGKIGQHIFYRGTPA